MRSNGAQSIVTGQTAALLDLEISELQFNIIMNHHDLRGLILEKAYTALHTFSTAIHKNTGFQQPNRRWASEY